MINKEKMKIMGNEKPMENPLPFFRELIKTPEISMKDSVLEEDKRLLGYETGARFLPYRIKDKYNRKKKEQTLETIVLENEKIKAVFLPEYGGRLYSLYHKVMRRELIYKNPVIQTANLAILDAWISGGIEWNIGQMGHTFTTCSPVFFCKLKDKQGNDFLRMFEYERCHELFWQVDFHLPPESETLQAYIRIVNDSQEKKSLYWWTNIAVPETKEVRIFSGARDVLYMDMQDFGYGRAQMPTLPILPEKDASYPSQFPYSNEYFFQTPEGEEMPWEAAVYPDFIFVECSSQLLKYRKMFCWGNQNGGNHWKDYLSEPGKGAYVEIQAGLSKTQRHGEIINPGETIEFVQCFGGMENQGEFYGSSWGQEKEKLEKEVHQWMTKEKMKRILEEWKQYADSMPEEFLSYGSGYGALEAKRREVEMQPSIPKGFLFPEDSIGKEQIPWLNLLDKGVYTEEEPQEFPSSYCVQKEWYERLKQSVKAASGQEGNCDGKTNLVGPAYVQMSVYLIENGIYDKARDVLKKALREKKTALAYRNLGYIAVCSGEMESAVFDYEQAISVCDPRQQGVLYAEYFKVLQKLGEYQKLFDCYQTLSEDKQAEEHLFVPAVFAALELKNLNFVELALKREYADIRENEVDLYRIWNQYHQKKIEKEQKRTISIEQIKELYPIPYELDFRTVENPC